MNNKYSGKRLIPLILVISLALFVAGGAYGATATAVMDVAPFSENASIYGPVRPVAESFGIYVDWDQESQQAILTRGARKVVVKADSADYTSIQAGAVDSYRLDAPAVLRDGRLFVPMQAWKDFFGFQVALHDDGGGYTVSEGDKILTLVIEAKELAMTGGHFLKTYQQDKSLSFYYPATGEVNIVWEGYAEILLDIDGDDYVIVAVNAGAGRSDPVIYTQDELDELIHQNADHEHVNVERLSAGWYGVPAYRFSGPEAGVPQAGIVFLRDGALCGLTVEAKRTPWPEIFLGNELEIVNEDGTDVAREDEESPVIADPLKLHEELAIVNAILDEIMASFMAH